MRKGKLNFWIGGFFSLLWLIGLSFKVLHIKGAGLMMALGSVGIAFIFIPIYLFSQRKYLAGLGNMEKLKWVLGLISISLLVVAITMQMMHIVGAALVWIWISTISVFQNMHKIPK